jgi:uncharacterized protein YndB with AHSA1/START domain
VKQLNQWWTNDICMTVLREMDARLGGKWRFVASKSSPDTNSVETFEIFGEIIEFEPPRRLAYSWLSKWHDQPEKTTTVRWELWRAGNATRVKMTHSGLGNQPAARKGYGEGWPGVVQHLKTFAERSPQKA